MHSSVFRSAAFTCIVFTALSSKAQTSAPEYEIGGGIGTYIYQGDLVTKWTGSYRYARPAITLYGAKVVNPYFSVRLNFTVGKILANEADFSNPAYKQMRNLAFSSSVKELSANIVFSPFGNSYINDSRRLYPYFFAGVGATFLNIKRDWSKMSATMLANEKLASGIAADSAHKVPAILPAIPVGAGLRYVLSPRIALYGQVTYTLPVSDYLDGFSYVGNPGKKDSYYGISFGVNYSLFKNKYKCPPVKR